MVLLPKTQPMQQCVLWEHLVFFIIVKFPHRRVDFFAKTWIVIVLFVNIEVNNLRKTPVLQLKQSNSILTLYLLNEQVVREKHVLGHTCHGLDN